MQTGINMEWGGTRQLEIWNNEERRLCKCSDFLMRGKSKEAKWILKGKNK